MKTIVLVNQKGGVGKTTFADEIAWGLERRGREVGFINLDPQGGASHEQKTVEGEKAVTVVDTPGYLNDKLGGCVPTAEAFKRGASFNRPVSEVQPGGRAADAIEGILDKVEAML